MTPAAGTPGAQMPRFTAIEGARMHNLRGVSCRIPHAEITVITGVSGSGKSTLAFDVLYAEGQRRYVECLSAYARQFLERLERPEAERIGHIQPPIALKQRVSIRNARSTVGSITELSDLLRLLYVHAGEIACGNCGGAVVRTESREALSALDRFDSGARIAIVAPLATTPDAGGLRRLRDDGYTRLLLGDEVVELDDLIAQPERLAAFAPRKPKKRGAGASTSASTHRTGVVIDRVVAGKTSGTRWVESIQTAWEVGGGLCRLHPLDRGTSVLLRRGMACSACDTPAALPTVGLFSWNNPIGACPECQGFGRIITLDRDKVVPDARKNLRNDAVVPFGVPSARAWYRRMLKAARSRAIPTDQPFGKLSAAQQEWIFAGDETFPGVNGFFERMERKRYKMHVRIFIARFRGYRVCPRCQGSRLRPEALAVTVRGHTIDALHRMPIGTLQAFFADYDATSAEAQGVASLIDEIHARVAYLMDIGVGYLSLGRSGRTLSGGETQRIRLAAALGSALTDTLYILDEPTVGLHATDSGAMLDVLRRLTELGNTVVVVEHDPGIIAGAEHLIVLGPGGGAQGGRLLYEGPVEAYLKKHPGFFLAEGALLAPRHTRTSPKRVRGLPRRASRSRKLGNPWNVAAVRRWLDAQERGRARASLRTPPGRKLEITGAREHNLKIASLEIPLSRLVVITGVSGSGKSTLLDEIIHRNWLRHKGRPVEDVGGVDRIAGFGDLEEVHLVGQVLLGRSSRSNPISFVQAYAEIRKLLAGTLAARQRGLEAGAFSFNTAGGRCDTCKGMGTQVLEMYFLPDVEVPCEVCGGKRFRPEVLAVTWHAKNIDAMLAMTVDEATAFFRREVRIVERLAPLQEVGLGYLALGQSTATLSGGEAQRLRLASFLAKRLNDERHLFLFDEPTTGLHARDVERLLSALRALLAQGHAVIVVEHHLDFIRAADWVVDLGPGPGDAGGEVVYAGPPAGLLLHEGSRTAEALRAHLGRIEAWSAGNLAPPITPQGRRSSSARK